MSQSHGEFSVVYDLTGLATRQAAQTPTGLDRVNLRYAQYFLEHWPAQALFVRQSGQDGIMVSRQDAADLVRYLDAAWSRRAGTEESWPQDAIAGANAADDSSLAFRVEHPAVSDPDFESFFALPFSERFDYLLRNSMQKELGPEFRWVGRFPFPLRVAYALGGSASKWLAEFLYGGGQFIGVLLQTRNPRLAIRAAFGRRRRAQTLKHHLAALLRSGPRRIVYVNTSQFVGLSLNYLEDLKESFGLEPVFLIHDLLPIHYPEYFIAESNLLLERRVHRMLGLRPILLANSEVTKSQVIEYAARQRIGVNGIQVAPLGVEPHFNGISVQAAPVDARPYFVVLSTIEARKNHLLLLNIWRELCARDPEHAPSLYLVGRRGWESEAVIDMLERCAALQGHVHEMTNMKDSELIQMLAHARALLAPSFSEGWGMPVVEALALGVPVICSDIPAFRESGQSIPDYIDPLDGPRWREAVLEYGRPDSTARQAQLVRMRAFQPPTWDQHFDRALGRILRGD